MNSELDYRCCNNDNAQNACCHRNINCFWVGMFTGNYRCFVAFCFPFQALEISFQFDSRLIASITIFFECFAYDPLQLWWNSGIKPIWRNGCSVQNGLEYHATGVTEKRKLCGNRFVQYGSEREQVGASIEFLPFDLFRGHVGDGAKRRTGAGQVLLRLYGGCAHANALRFQRDFRQPEIENLRLTSIRNEDVRWLDVSMDDALRMCCIERVGNLDAEIEHRFDFQRLAIDLMPERLPLQQFHRNESSTIDLIDLMDCAYARVIECGRGLGFAFKAGECLRVAGNFLGQELKGNEAMQSRVLSLIDHAHASAAELFDDAVVRNGLPDEL